MNIEELQEALETKQSAISEKVNKYFPIGFSEREAFYDRLLDQLEILYRRGEVTQDVYEQYRASYMFERDGTVIRYEGYILR